MRIEYNFQLDQVTVPRLSVEATEGIGKLFTLATLALNVLDVRERIELVFHGLNPEDLDACRKDPKLKVWSATGMNVGYLAMNTTRKPFDDARVRRAVALAIDRRKLVDALYLGMGKPAAEPLENLAQRLKDALASNTIGGGRRREPTLDWRQASDEVSRLRATWAKTAPVPGEEGRSLYERYQRACRKFVDRRPPERPRSHSSERPTLSRP